MEKPKPLPEDNPPGRPEARDNRDLDQRAQDYAAVMKTYRRAVSAASRQKPSRLS
jgi:hypothetical protein